MSRYEKQLQRALREFVEAEVNAGLNQIKARVRDAVQAAVAQQFGGSTLPVLEKVRTARVETPKEFRNPICQVKGCQEAVRCKGYCNAHYQRARVRGWPIPAPRNFSPPPHVRTRQKRKEAAPEASEAVLADPQAGKRVRTMELPAT